MSKVTRCVFADSCGARSSARTDTDVLHRAIMQHGGEARNSVQAFIDMPVSEKIALATFLLTL